MTYLLKINWISWNVCQLWVYKCPPSLMLKLLNIGIQDGGITECYKGWKSSDVCKIFNVGMKVGRRVQFEGFFFLVLKYKIAACQYLLIYSYSGYLGNFILTNILLFRLCYEVYLCKVMLILTLRQRLFLLKCRFGGYHFKAIPFTPAGTNKDWLINIWRKFAYG